MHLKCTNLTELQKIWGTKTSTKMDRQTVNLILYGNLEKRLVITHKNKKQQKNLWKDRQPQLEKAVKMVTLFI